MEKVTKIKIAFYKYPRESAWYKVVLHQLTCWWTRGEYSHVEVVLGRNADGTNICASSSARDGGVRIKNIKMPSYKWDLIEVEADVAQVRAWFDGQEGKKYDYLAWLGFLWRRETGSRNRWFCSEAVATALGYADGWRFDPNTLFVILKGIDYDKRDTYV